LKFKSIAENDKNAPGSMLFEAPFICGFVYRLRRCFEQLSPAAMASFSTAFFGARWRTLEHEATLKQRLGQPLTGDS
jgi:hypothetical protein